MKSRRFPLALFCQFLLAFAGSLTLATSLVHAEPAVVDGVAALVNGDVITFSQVRDLVGPREASLRNSYSGAQLMSKIKEVRQGALQDLIDKQLILQEFKKKEFAIPPRLVDEHVDAIVRERFGGDRQAFIRTLQAQGYTLAKFREAEHDKIVVQAMRYQNAKGDFIVSPLKVDALYTTNKTEFTTPEQIHLWMISLNKGTNLAPGEADPQKALAEEIRAKAAKGGKFDQLAQMYSVDSSRTAGGDWGWVERKVLNENLTNAAFKLDVNKVSPVIQDGNFYYVLKVTEKKSSFTKPETDVRADLEKKLFSDERARMQDQWIAGLRAKAFIKTF